MLLTLITLNVKLDVFFIVNGTKLIGFTAYATAVRSYNQMETVSFDGVVTNFGNHYNAINSIFTCPHDGLYVFYVSLQSPPNFHMHGSITKEHQVFTTARADYEDNTNGSTMTVLMCATGERVWIETPNASNRKMFGDTVKRYSVFSGFFLHAE